MSTEEKEPREAAPQRVLGIPTPSLVLLVGASGAGKSTFARKHFLPTEIVSSDRCRALVADDENDQSVTPAAFEILHVIARKRLEAGKLVVVDATNVQLEARRPLIALARSMHVFAVAIVLDMPERFCVDNNERRDDRDVGPHVVRRQIQELRASLRNMEREGLRTVHVLRRPEEIEKAVVERQRLWTDRRDERGPFDIIGDVHGCADELLALLDELGYRVEWDESAPFGVRVAAPQGRKVVFLGDLIDRGPRIADTLRIAMSMVQAGAALCIPGNHEAKLLRKLRGRNVTLTHGLDKTVAELDRETPAFREEVARFIDGLVSHFVLDEGRLVVAHAGMKAEMQGRASGAVREFALYGDTTGETDEYGLPIRNDWAADYRGRAAVVYGHTPVPTADWLNNTLCVDTGCVFGGALTALRWPEREIVSIPAARQYCEPKRPLLPPEPDLRTAQQQHDDMLDIADVLGKRVVTTRLVPHVTVREENAAAALEAMSRFAMDPRWLVYLPPTMSPSETSEREGTLEHPAEAFEYFRRQGVQRVVCEEKHMGSRAVLIVCRDAEVARPRFGVTGGEAGAMFTRTGRPFFDDPALTAAMLDRVRRAAEASGLFEALETSWLCLDAELMPWSAKAQELLRVQYAPVGAVSRAALGMAAEDLERAVARGVGAGELLARIRTREEASRRYTEAYRRYCWPVERLTDYRLAPFHLLAAEGAVFAERDHLWHMEQLGRLAAADGEVLMATRHITVDLADAESEAAATAWWEALTASGGEGMVVKPLSFWVRGKRGLVQPALKCRGREYLRIIYGPEYDLPENVARLRSRGLAAKRTLALREFALGVEALERFIRKEPLRRVHECVFAILAMESEPVDPRL
jgi:polynucleotide kinase-phosphatase